MAYTYGYGKLRGQTADEAQVINTAPTDLSTGLYGERYAKGVEALTPEFAKARLGASNVLGARGLGRTSMFANSMTDITAKENLAKGALYQDIAKAAQEESMRRDFEGMSASKFNVDLNEKRRQYDANMRWQDYMESEKSNNAKRAADIENRSKGWETFGKLVSSGIENAAQLAPLLTGSDERIKENIVELKEPLNTLMKLDVKKYNYVNNSKETFGVIAQELEKVLPGLVVTTDNSIGDAKNLKAVDIYGLLALTMAAVQELAKKAEK